jgi:hypothetical protein
MSNVQQIYHCHISVLTGTDPHTCRLLHKITTWLPLQTPMLVLSVSYVAQMAQIAQMHDRA